MPSIAHISINVTDTDSPSCVRRRIHLRSLSDVTPASRAHTPRARSHSERPRASPAPSPAHPAPSPAHAAPSPAHPAPSPAHAAPAAAPAPRSPAAVAAPVRFVRSERSSPDASLLAFDDAFASSETGITRRFTGRDRAVSDAVSVLGNPWRKMSEVDLNAAAARGRAGGRPGLDPWVRNPTLRSETPGERAAARDEPSRAASEPEPKREGAPVKRGKLERKSPVGCSLCGDDSCSCWRAGWARARAARSLGAQCTCAGAAEAGAGAARSPRPSPARLAPRVAPARAQSDDEGRAGPRRLYKSSSQRQLVDERAAPDPLLETTC